ncbi:uncharacterized protein LOC128341604 isoform X2 [Hemicordylus capensis]|uniref:uncharacterized protein LOC128341604 isoform X2 n=1 Tax=Hemicordylus capensis TaxID=884348 RepID=UPI0023021026|nr:uncharacterized protein LOC128341604 isoform X2 [Hemicordylus capensis]
MAQPTEVPTHAPTASVPMDSNIVAIIIATNCVASRDTWSDQGALHQRHHRSWKSCLEGKASELWAICTREDHPPTPATVSSSMFIVAILVLLLLLYHRDPLCCQFLCSCRFFQSPSQYDCPPPYFSSNQRLVGPQSGTPRLESAAENPGIQGDELFCVGPPTSYQLPSWEEPRLPSYESVRKKDRQREIHQMIAERFGLWAEVSPELPPPYEQALRYPAALSGNGAGSELSARQSLPDMLQASPTYQPHRNTSV